MFYANNPTQSLIIQKAYGALASPQKFNKSPEMTKMETPIPFFIFLHCVSNYFGRESLSNAKVNPHCFRKLN